MTGPVHQDSTCMCLSSVAAGCGGIYGTGAGNSFNAGYGASYGGNMGYGNSGTSYKGRYGSSYSSNYNAMKPYGNCLIPSNDIIIIILVLYQYL